MSSPAEAPFEGYTLYKVFHKKEGRTYAQLVNPEAGHRTTISFARYLVSVREGRLLTSNEEVDHRDNDRTNDSPDTLQILSPEENLRKHAALALSRRIMLTRNCPMCGNPFSVRVSNKRLKPVLESAEDGPVIYCLRWTPHKRFNLVGFQAGLPLFEIRSTLRSPAPSRA